MVSIITGGSTAVDGVTIEYNALNQLSVPAGALNWVSEKTASVGATANEVSVTSLTAKKHYRAVLKITTDTPRSIYIKINADSTANYETRTLSNVTLGTSAGTAGFYIGEIGTTERTIVLDLVQTGAGLLMKSFESYLDSAGAVRTCHGTHTGITADITSIQVYAGAGTVALDYNIASLTTLATQIGV